MSVKLGSAYGKVEIDVSGVEGSISNAQRSLSGFQSSLDKIGRNMIGAGAGLTAGVTAPLLALGAAGLTAASDLEESQNKVEVVFGDSATAIEDWSSRAAEAFGQSQQQALEAAGTFGNLFSAMGFGVEESGTMSKGMVELASDLASFNNIGTDEALEKLRAGLVGEAEPLRTLGVNLTEAGVQAKAMEMGLAGSAKELTAADKVTARYALIMEQTKNAQGDFARTSDGLANSTRIMKAQWKDASAALAKELLPVALDVVQVISDLLKAFTDLPDPVKKGIVVVAGIAAVVGPVLLAVGSMVTAISGIAGVLSGLGGAVAAVAAAIGTALAPVLVIVAAVALVAGLLYLAWKTNFLGLRDIVDAIWGAIKTTFEQIKAIVGNVMAFLRGEITFDELAGRVKDSLAKIGEAWRAAWERLGQIVAEVWPRIQELVTRALGALGNAIIEKVAEFIAPLVGGMDKAKEIVTTAFQNVAEFLAGIWDGIKNIAGKAWDGIKTVIGNAVEAIRTVIAVVLQALSGDWVGAFEKIRSGIAEVMTVITGLVAAGWERLVGVVSGIMERLKGVIMGAWEAVKGAYYALKGEDPSQIVTPEQAAAQVAIWQEMVNQFTLTWQLMQTTVTTIANAIKVVLDAWLAAIQAGMQSAWAAVLSETIRTWNAIRSAVVSAAQQMASGAVNAIQNMRNRIVGILNDLAGAARRAGEAIGRALADGMRSQVGAVAAAAAALARAVRDNLPGSDAKEGPLSDLTAAGMALPETLALGIKAGQDALTRAAQTMAGVVSGAMTTAWTPAMAAAQPAAVPAANGGYGSATVNVYVDRIGDDVDVESLAYRISEVLKWRQR